MVACLLQVELCGHATLAASHFLFASGLVKSDVVEFLTLSGLLTAKRVLDTKSSDSSNSQTGNAPESFLIELDFPVVSLTEYDSSADLSIISESLNGASVIEIQKTSGDDLLVSIPLALCVKLYLLFKQMLVYFRYTGQNI